MSEPSPEPTSNGVPWIAVHATTADPDIIEMCAAVGAQLYVIDLEHGTSSDSSCASAVRAGDASRIAVAVRLAKATLGRVGRLLDAGAAGAIVADVRCADDCATAADAVFHSPCGRRGVGGCRENAYGLDSLGIARGEHQHIPALASRPFLSVQIESAAGLSKLDEILDVERVDMVSIGTRDLAVDLGQPGDMTHPDIESATRHVAEEAHRRGTSFAHMIRTLDQVQIARRLAPEWLLLPLAAIVRVGLESFSNRISTPRS